jgi:glycosyltransferase involved in cell wall biosynthesis
MVRSIPVKVLEYMACELPIILTDVPFWRELFGDIPLYVAEPSAAFIAAALTELINDPSSRSQRADQGLALLRAKGWYWENERASLLALYDDLCEAEHAAS